jgi:hypothetical protein
VSTYVTVDELKAQIQVGDSYDDGAISLALSAASAEVDQYCGRNFDVDASVTVRTFRADGEYVETSDIATTTGLIVRVDTLGDGTFPVTVAAADYVLEPLNGVGVDGRVGWPYTAIRFADYDFKDRVRPTVQVTARFGWLTVPEAVKQATLLLAARNFKLREAPLGVAGFGDFGAVRVRDNPIVATILRPYRRGGVADGFA